MEAVFEFRRRFGVSNMGEETTQFSQPQFSQPQFSQPQFSQSQWDEMMGSEQIKADLEAIANLVRKAAQQHQDNNLTLLALLRLLEALHQEVRDDFFQKTLPDNRQALYNLLKDIEAAGGWPYIHRMKLQEFLINFPLERTETDGFQTDSAEE